MSLAITTPLLAIFDLSKKKPLSIKIEARVDFFNYLDVEFGLEFFAETNADNQWVDI